MLYTELTGLLEQVRRAEADVIKRTERSITVASQVMDKLREFIVSASFADKAEEICFFKIWKPHFYRHLIYFLRVLRIESRKPFGNKEEIESYYKKQQTIINYFVENNLDFYQYFRMKAEHFDEKYFLRSQPAIYLDVDYVYFNSDPRFSSSQDYKMAKVLANDMLTAYLEDCVQTLHIPPGGEDNVKNIPKLTWTASKASLIELIYALQENGVFNGGNADIRQIAGFFEARFNVDLGNYYRVFQDIRIRKKNRTIFLDQLKEVLEKRMNDTDGHLRRVK